MPTTMKIAGYVFESELVTANGIKVLFDAEHADFTAEELLDSIARERGIDRNDVRTFDSCDFPKVVLQASDDAVWFDGYDDRSLPIYLSSVEL